MMNYQHLKRETSLYVFVFFWDMYFLNWNKHYSNAKFTMQKIIYVLFFHLKNAQKSTMHV